MAGRDVTNAHKAADRPRRRKAIWVILLAILVVFVSWIGIGIGKQSGGLGDADKPERTRSSGTEGPVAGSAPGAAVALPPSGRRTRATSTRSEAGAVTAAAAAVTAFDGDVMLNPKALRSTVDRIASAKSRASFLRAFTQARDQLRRQLATNSVPRPVVLLRTFAIGYRVETYSKKAATIAVWNVGVVGSGATLQPHQSWRTQRVSLVWENAAWKVTKFESERGPTPPLASADAADSPGDLFARVPAFKGFEHASP